MEEIKHLLKEGLLLLREIRVLLIELKSEGKKMYQQFLDLQQSVEAEGIDISALAAYVSQLAAELAAVKDAPTPADIQAILDKVNEHKAALENMMPAPSNPAPPA